MVWSALGYQLTGIRQQRLRKALGIGGGGEGRTLKVQITSHETGWQHHSPSPLGHPLVPVGLLRDPLASTAQPLSSGSPDCSSVTRLLLGPCYTDPEILDAEGTQLSGQTELLKLGSLGPRNQPGLSLC